MFGSSSRMRRRMLFTDEQVIQAPSPVRSMVKTIPLFVIPHGGMEAYTFLGVCRITFCADRALHVMPQLMHGLLWGFPLTWSGTVSRGFGSRRDGCDAESASSCAICAAFYRGCLYLLCQ